MIFDPFGFKSIDFRPRSTFQLHLLQRLCKGRGIFDHAEDELVVSDVDSAADEFAALGVCASNDQVLRAHDIPLISSGIQSIDVFANRYEHFACKMPAFLAAMELVFEVDGCSTVLCEELGELHYGCEAPMSVDYYYNVS